MKKEEHYLVKLVEYSKKNLKKGYTKDSLKWALVKQGYARLEIDKALLIAEKELSKEAPILKTRPEIKYETLPPTGVKKIPWFKKFFQ